MLLIQQKYELDLKIQPIKVLQIQPAYDNTFALLLLELQQTSYEKVLHVTSSGSIIKQYLFQSNLNSISMISPYQIAIAMVQQNFLMLINLKQLKTEKITHIFKRQAIDQTELFVFPLSALFCISEYSVQTRNNLKLTYYSQTQKTIAIQFEQNTSELQNLIFICKSNNNSQIAWYIRNYKQNSQEIVLHDIITYNLVRSSRIRKIKINDFTLANYKTQSLLNVTKIWNLGQQEYIILLSPKNVFYFDGLQTYNFLIVKNYNKTICLPKFKTPNNYGQSVINIHFTQDYFIMTIRQLKMTEFYKQTLNYVLYNSEQKMIKNQQEISNQPIYQFYPTYEYNTLIKVKYTNKIQLLLDKAFKFSQIYLHFLLAIYQNFDDDLLQDTLQLLKQDQSH